MVEAAFDLQYPNFPAPRFSSIHNRFVTLLFSTPRGSHEVSCASKSRVVFFLFGDHPLAIQSPIVPRIHFPARTALLSVAAAHPTHPGLRRRSRVESRVVVALKQ